MPTQCNAAQVVFSWAQRRRVVATFDGGATSSNGGALLLGKADLALGLIDRLSACFIDERRADLVDHSLDEHRALADGLAGTVQKIHARWLEQRERQLAGGAFPEIVRREPARNANKVGRNAPPVPAGRAKGTNTVMAVPSDCTEAPAAQKHFWR